MRTHPILQCVRVLDFQPEQVWSPVFPAYCWNKLLLTGFNRGDGEAVDLCENQQKPMTFSEAFVACYQKLNLPELARLRKCLIAAQQYFPTEQYWSEIVGYYGYQHTPILERTLSQLNRTSHEFQDWVGRRQLSPGDLAVLRLVEDFKPFEIILSKLSKMNPTKSTGVQCLELAVELILRGHDPQEVIPYNQQAVNAEVWLKQLFTLRNPMTAMGDESQAQTWMQLPWPTQTQVRWLRLGDRCGVEVKFICANQEELRRKVEGLARVVTAMNEKSFDELTNQV